VLTLLLSDALKSFQMNQNWKPETVSIVTTVGYIWHKPVPTYAIGIARCRWFWWV